MPPRSPRVAALALLIGAGAAATASRLALASPPRAAAGDADTARPRKVLLIAGPITGHPKEAHEYEKSVILLKHLIDTSPGTKGLRAEAHFKGWPADPRALDGADAVVLISDGGDRLETDHPLYVGDRLEQLEAQIRRGCGLVNLHWTTFHPSRFHDRVTESLGGYFDYETGPGEREWFSKIEHGTWDVRLPRPEHPIARGARPFRLQEEMYYNLKFQGGDPRLAPVAAIDRGSGLEGVVGWAIERAGGGRAFGFTGGHFFENWWIADYRRLLLNGIAWAAGAEVPEGGVETVLDERSRVTIVTGHYHPAHDWRATTAALVHVLEQDPRVKVDVTEDVEDLGRPKLEGCAALVLNYSNWDRPGLSEAAKRGLVRYLSGGGGLTVLHFANGAFNFSIPARNDTDWEEFRTRIVRRAWIHGEGRSGHDPFGAFRVELGPARHPITEGLSAFDTEDELYFKQEGDLPIEPLVQARSKVTGRDEPLAWAYEHGKGRVFQTLLGHADVSVRKAGALIRRGTVWAAGRSALSFDPPVELTEGALFREGSPWTPAGSLERSKGKPATGSAPAPLPAPPGKPRLAEGRSGKALDARAGGVVLPGKPELRSPPLGVECWARLESREGFNILVASEEKASPTHWELYTYAGTGALSFYIPGFEPAEVKSAADVCDGAWHRVACAFEESRVRLSVDGKEVLDRPVRRLAPAAPTLPPPLAPPEASWLGIGTLVERSIGCRGLVDEVRISRGAEALGVWSFESEKELEPPRSSAVLPPNPGLDGGLGGHWGMKDDADWVDDRFSRMDTGPFLSSSLETPAGTVEKAISLKLGDRAEAAACFDAAALSLRAGWTGGFLELSPARFGLIEKPRIAGAIAFRSPPGPGWEGGRGTYRGLYLHGRRAVLSYLVDAMEVLDASWVEATPAGIAFTRALELGPSATMHALSLLEVPGASCEVRPSTPAGPIARLEAAGAVTVAALRGSDAVGWALRGGSRLALEVPEHASPLKLEVVVWKGPLAAERAFLEHLERASRRGAEDLRPLLEPGPPLWPERLRARGHRSDRSDPYVIDTISVPHENPWHALLFLSGHDFLESGDAAVCSVHGDVWLVSRIDERLEDVAWKRFATGLYQPLGLKVAGGRVHVLGRDQITVLHDQDSDGEADLYECLTNAPATSSGGHDYHACLEADAEGNLYYASPRGLHRVAPDGSRHETLATGFRNPCGLGVGPGGIITVAPQEGEWTPASMICEVRPGGHYGYGGPRPGPERPLGYDPPLCYVPRHVDNSTGGQVWAPPEGFGPLSGQLLSLSFGRSSLQLVLREVAGGQAQGGVVPLKLRFLSGAMRGRFHPRDGHLYVTGLTGWSTNAIADGCFQRVRWTSAKAYLPVGLSPRANGLLLRFSEPLERASAEDPGSFAVRRWAYRYAASYGSEEYSVASPGVVGHDPVEVRSTALLEDGRSVFLEVPGILPVHQMHVRGSLLAADGTDFSFDVYPTIHRLGPPVEVGDGEESEEEEPAAPPGEAGLSLTFTGLATGERDARVARLARLAALRVPEGERPSAFLEPGPFEARWEGKLLLEARSRLRFSASGRGRVRLAVDGAVLLEAEGEDLSRAEGSWARLPRGERAFALEYRSPPPRQGDAWVRLYWEGPGFARETVPATAFRRGPASPELAQGLLLREGLRLFEERRCAACHLGPSGPRPDAPSLEGIGSRLEEGWMARWIADPRSLRPDASVPCLAGPDERSARDIAAYLATLREPDGGSEGREPPGDLGGGDGEPAGAGGAAGTAGAAVTARAAGAAGARSGAELFASLGCIGCHTLPDVADAADVTESGDPHDRIALGGVASRWRPRALEAYLERPSRHHPASRMPDFGLSALEARRLAAFLLGRSAPDRSVADRSLPELGPGAGTGGDPRHGERLVATLGCLACHALPGGPRNELAARPLEAIAAADWASSGCVAEGSRRGRAPDLGLGKPEREALLALRAEGLAGLGRETAAELAERQVRSLRCGACHERDGVPSTWSLVEAEVAPFAPAAPPGVALQARPSLTFAGEQFRHGWLRDLLAGRLAYKPRPWLRARMPAFGAQADRVDRLAEGLVLEHGCPLEGGSVDGEPAARHANGPSAELAAAGRRLLGAAGGLSCITCHAVGARPPSCSTSSARST
ncbi:MAG: ThuA domain-containing protein [Planctomycetes bacterium]|nr:ThuA domain-containing protein [Planctomycetota bacterium]